MIPFMLLLLSYNCAIFASASNDQEKKYYVTSKDQKTYKVPESPPIIIQSSPESYGTSPGIFGGCRHLELMRQNSIDMKEQREKQQAQKAKAGFKECMLVIATLRDNALEALKEKTPSSASNSDEDSDDSDDKSLGSDGDLFNMEL